MNTKAYAKINLNLDITGRMDDGYHSLSMIMQSLKLHDDIELYKLPKGRIELEITDLRGENLRRLKAGRAGTGETVYSDIAAPVDNVIASPELVSVKHNFLSAASADTVSAKATAAFSAETEKPPAAMIPADKRNLMYRAAELMTEHYDIDGGIGMRLVKRIPSEAGLGGGSADAAAVINGINELYELKRPITELQELGLGLGADIPYCITGGTALAEGKGEQLTAIHTDIRLYVLIIKPAAGMSTPAVYKSYDSIAYAGNTVQESGSVGEKDGSGKTECSGETDCSGAAEKMRKEEEGAAYSCSAGISATGSIADTGRNGVCMNSIHIAHPDVRAMQKALETGNIEEALANMGNVLEYAVVSELPLIETIKKDLISAGALASSMTGSGSAVYGLFDKMEDMHAAARHFTEIEYIEQLSDVIETEFR